jgi:hypothetical protein
MLSNQNITAATPEVWNAKSADGRWVTYRAQRSKAYHYAQDNTFLGIGLPPMVGKSCMPMNASVFYAWDDLILEAGNYYGVDPVLIKAVVMSESAFNRWAISKAGAMGGAQIMPKTARTLGVDDPFNPAEFIPGCAAHLRRTMDHFKTANMVVMVSAYNAGDGAVERAIKRARAAGRGDDIRNFIPVNNETPAYVNTVLWTWHRMHTGS